MSKRVNRQWLLAKRPEGMLTATDFEWRETETPPLGDGQVLIRNVYLSLDPANRGWVMERKTYVDPVAIGEVMRGIAIGVVAESKHPDFQVGDWVQGMLGWQDYLVSDGEGLTVLPRNTPAKPLDFLGPLGPVGLTAYFGLLEVGGPKEGETLLVSAAAGAVGSLVGQIGKLKGCRVVGIAGSDEKCDWIVRDLGFDAAINYKSQDVAEALKETCPNGVDIYFDNVGGAILDAALGRINQRGRVVVCGLISQYNATEPTPGPYNFINVLTQRARIEGFIVMDYLPRAKEALAFMIPWMAQDKLRWRAHIVSGLEKAPEALNMLFAGGNTGKLILQVSEPPAG